jgi:TonB family protein
VHTIERARASSDPALIGLGVFLLVSCVCVASAAQNPNVHLRDLAASGQADAIRALLSDSEQLVDSTDEAGWTALMHAATAGHEAVVRLLLEADADVQLRNAAQDTALHLAAQRGQTEAVRLLLEAGADFAARDADGRTSLFLAIERGDAEIIALLHNAALANSSRLSPVRALAPEGETVPPVIIQWLDASYTDSALKQGVEGSVVLMAIVRQDGSIGAVSVSESLEESLDRRALEAVRTWEFEPATRAGKPVVVVVEIRVDFELPEER